MSNQINLHIYRNDMFNETKSIIIDKSTTFEKLLKICEEL